MKLLELPLLIPAFLQALTFCGTALAADQLYTRPAGIDTRWSSFESSTGAPGNAAKENQGGKGHSASERVKASNFGAKDGMN